MQYNKKETSISRIKAIIKRYGMSISRIANIIGKDRITFIGWLNGKSKKDISLNTKAKICEFLAIQ